MHTWEYNDTLCSFLVCEYVYMYTVLSCNRNNSNNRNNLYCLPYFPKFCCRSVNLWPKTTKFRLSLPLATQLPRYIRTMVMFCFFIDFYGHCICPLDLIHVFSNKLLSPPPSLSLSHTHTHVHTHTHTHTHMYTHTHTHVHTH